MFLKSGWQGLFFWSAKWFTVGSLIFLLLRLLTQLKPNLFIGKIQFGLRILENTMLLVTFTLMFVFYLGEAQIYLTFDESDKLGLAAFICIFLYMFFCIVEKVVFNLKLETGWMKSKKIANENEDIIFAQKIEEADNEADLPDNVSDTSYKNRAFMNTNHKASDHKSPM